MLSSPCSPGSCDTALFNRRIELGQLTEDDPEVTEEEDCADASYLGRSCEGARNKGSIVGPLYSICAP